MPIVIAPLNTDLKIIKILTDSKTKTHLENLGLMPGSNIKILSNTNGNVILQVMEGRLALNKEIATKILVG